MSRRMKVSVVLGNSVTTIPRRMENPGMEWKLDEAPHDRPVEG